MISQISYQIQAWIDIFLNKNFTMEGFFSLLHVYSINWIIINGNSMISYYDTLSFIPVKIEVKLSIISSYNSSY